MTGRVTEIFYADF